MNERALRTQADKYRLDPLVSPRYRPILVSDSKGLTLQTQVRVNHETFLEFWCESGATAENRLQYLRDNLEHELRQPGSKPICLFIWVGTCNLTKKDGQFIYLKSQTNSEVTKLCNTYIYHFGRQFEDVKLIFLHLPVYSTFHWNSYKNIGIDVTKFWSDDKILHEQIRTVNEYIIRSQPYPARHRSKVFGGFA